MQTVSEFIKTTLKELEGFSGTVHFDIAIKPAGNNVVVVAEPGECLSRIQFDIKIVPQKEIEG